MRRNYVGVKNKWQKGMVINMKKFTEKTPENCLTFINGLISQLSSEGEMSFSELKPENSALIIVDVVNGFIREGAMASSQISGIIPSVVELMKLCNSKDIPIVAFADCHKKNCAEFSSFPPHCIENTSEAELVDEIIKAGGYIKLKKNSTNGFHEKEFLQCLIQNPQTNTYIVTGDCTDICVLQLCLSLKTWFTAQNRNVNIIVPLDCVETYDSPEHNSDFMNLAAYKLMLDSGIKFVSSIKKD
jgi:nicotinamidase-related amidase